MIKHLIDENGPSSVQVCFCLSSVIVYAHLTNISILD